MQMDENWVWNREVMPSSHPVQQIRFQSERFGCLWLPDPVLLGGNVLLLLLLVLLLLLLSIPSFTDLKTIINCNSLKLYNQPQFHQFQFDLRKKKFLIKKEDKKKTPINKNPIPIVSVHFRKKLIDDYP